MRVHRTLALCVVFLAPCLAASPPDNADKFFGVTSVREFHLTIAASDWNMMQPAEPNRTPGGRGGPPPRMQFPFVHASLSSGGQTLDNIGLRFKGNSSYRAANGGIKFPLKLDFNRYVKGQKFLGLSQLNLSNNAMDPAQSREALAYSIFRAAGIPSSRTAFIKVYLTVPGQFADRYVGLYTAVEDVGKQFLKSHFDSSKGMLLKPEGMRGFPYLGDNWDAYKASVGAKTDVSAAEARHFVELARLVNTADDDAFRAGIEKSLDVEEFLRFIAANAALANLDSILSMGHNYYLYLNPSTGKFVFIPWDLNEAFAAFMMGGSSDQQVTMSIKHPHAGQNRLIERLLAIPEYAKSYRQHLADLIAGPLDPHALDAQLATIEQACKEALSQEPPRDAARAGGAGMQRGPGMMNEPDVRQFNSKRVASIADQLAGRSEGTMLEMRNGPPGGRPPGQGPRPPRFPGPFPSDP